MTMRFETHKRGRATPGLDLDKSLSNPRCFVANFLVAEATVLSPASRSNVMLALRRNTSNQCPVAGFRSTLILSHCDSGNLSQAIPNAPAQIK
ncbi:type IV secretory pathway protease TraF [Rhodopirellula rubra]|uniref:Type IV secretory pathway protease TraF n=1 Tax=Aporhodopirellula rubra TaxID=980271 RepID=A0A7W5DYA6_9BACT|nr:type IV secretory pathway protease TraF [Aporhodopirellula rubra]